jgi:hypothetical protein
MNLTAGWRPTTKERGGGNVFGGVMCGTVTRHSADCESSIFFRWLLRGKRGRLWAPRLAACNIVRNTPGVEPTPLTLNTWQRVSAYISHYTVRQQRNKGMKHCSYTYRHQSNHTLTSKLSHLLQLLPLSLGLYTDFRIICARSFCSHAHRLSMQSNDHRLCISDDWYESLCVTSPLCRFTINVRVGGSEHNCIRGKDSLFNRRHVSALLLGHHQVNTEKVL